MGLNNTGVWWVYTTQGFKFEQLVYLMERYSFHTRDSIGKRYKFPAIQVSLPEWAGKNKIQTCCLPSEWSNPKTVKVQELREQGARANRLILAVPE